MVKAYTMHDLATPYHVGMVYIAAVLVEHMPEEEAFALFARLMDRFKLRDLFQQGKMARKLQFLCLCCFWPASWSLCELLPPPRGEANPF